MNTAQDRANKVIAQGALTNSKRPETFVKGVYPTHLRSSYDCFAYDENGNRYFDFITGLGSNLLGYQEDIDIAIRHAYRNGANFSLGSYDEIVLAEIIQQLFPFTDCMKFLKTGTEACNAAVRIARAYTGKKYILSEGYHGWGDGFVSMTPPALGILDDHFFYDLNKFFNDRRGIIPNDVSAFFDDRSDITPNKVAAIIVEPIITDRSSQRIEYLKFLRKYCTDNNIVLIFDEIITGFRYLDLSVAKHYSIYPDIILFGKAIAGGLPLSVVAGKKEIMNCGEYFVSSTFAGDRLAINAAITTINLLKTKYKISDLWQKGITWLDQFNSFYPEKIQIEGYPTRGRFVGDEMTKALFFQESCKAGLLFGPSWFFNFPLSDRNSITIDSVKDILWKIKNTKLLLEGEPPKSPFAEQMRKKSAG